MTNREEVFLDKCDVIVTYGLQVRAATLHADPLDMVQMLRMIAETAESALPYAVEQARLGGSTWEQVARMLGTTRQGAQQRFGVGA